MSGLDGERCEWCRYYVPATVYLGSPMSEFCCRPGVIASIPAAGYCDHYEREPGAGDDREQEGAA